jgi:hypothetical protein
LSVNLLPSAGGQSPSAGCQRRAESNYRCSGSLNYSSIVTANGRAPRLSAHLDASSVLQPRWRRAAAAASICPAARPRPSRSSSSNRVSRQTQALARRQPRPFDPRVGPSGRPSLQAALPKVERLPGRKAAELTQWAAEVVVRKLSRHSPRAQRRTEQRKWKPGRVVFSYVRSSPSVY